MRNNTIRWMIYLISLLIAGPAAGALVGTLRNIDGGPASPLNSTTPLLGLGLGLAALVIALVTGLVAAKPLGIAPAMTGAGLVVAWTSWRTADVNSLIRASHSGAPLTNLAIEGAVFGVAGFVIALGCWVLGRGKSTAAEAGTDERAKIFAPKAIQSVVIGLVAGGIAAWLVAASPLKGQAVFATIVAGTFAAAACRLVDFETPIPAVFVSIAGLAILGPLTGSIMAGTGGVVAQSYKNSLFPLANISALDWIAGGLLGIPIGVAWAGSMIEKRTQAA